MLQVLLGLVCLIVLLLAYQATRTVLALRHVKHDVGVLNAQVQNDDAAGVKATLADLRSEAHTAHAHSGNVLWAGLTHLPWLGGDVRAVRQASRALDSAASTALPTALDLYQSLQQEDLRTSDGRFNLTLIAGLQAPLQRLGTQLAPARRDLAGIEPDSLRLGSVRTATREFQSRLKDLTSLSDAGSTAARLLPSMLGGSGTRTYLLMAQNNAEIRSTGGLPGSFSLIEAKQGRLKLTRQFPNLAFPLLDAPVLELPVQERALHTDQMAEEVRDVNVTPDFPLSARILDAMYVKQFGRHVDGVVALDPIVLSALLGATGPVDVGGESFTTDNVVSKLLNTVYLRFTNPDRQNAYFAAAAKGIFDHVSSQPVSTTALLRKLSPMASQRRLLIWSRTPAEQALLSPEPISGALPQPRAAAVQTGMYLDDATAAKMQYYLDYVGGIRTIGCDRSGSQRYETRLRLRSDAPSDASGLPAYITGNGKPKGSMLMRLYVYGPAGGRITSIDAGGQPVKFAKQAMGDRQVGYFSIQLPAQSHLDITAEVQTAAGQRGAPKLVWTPGVRTGDTSVSVPSACS